MLCYYVNIKSTSLPHVPAYAFTRSLKFNLFSFVLKMLLLVFFIIFFIIIIHVSFCFLFFFLSFYLCLINVIEGWGEIFLWFRVGF